MSDVTVSRVTELRAEENRARQTKGRAASQTGSDKGQKHEFWGSECVSNRPPTRATPELPLWLYGVLKLWDLDASLAVLHKSGILGAAPPLIKPSAP